MTQTSLNIKEAATCCRTSVTCLELKEAAKCSKYFMNVFKRKRLVKEFGVNNNFKT